MSFELGNHLTDSFLSKNLALIPIPSFLCVRSLRHSMVCYLLSHVSCWSFMSSKLPLLRALSLVSDSSKLSILLPKIRSISSTSNLKDSTANFERRALSRLSDSKKEGYVSLLLASFDSTARLTLEDGSSGAWSTFLACLSESDGESRTALTRI